jgi:hypothetical protein
MPREAKPDGSISKRSAWRDAYDVTETQAKALVAIMAAQRLGYDGATIKAMMGLGLTTTEAHQVSALRHAGLVELVGFIPPRVAVYMATPRCFKRFGVPLPRQFPNVVQMVCGWRELAAYRMQRREQSARWREKQKGVG